MAKSILSEQIKLILEPILDKYCYEINDEMTRTDIFSEIKKKLYCHTLFGNDAYKTSCVCDYDEDRKELTCKIKLVPCLEEDWKFAKPMSKRERPGKMLLGLRLRAELTQKEFANKVKLSVKTISKMERNKQEITSEQAEIFAKILKTTKDDFLS